MSAVRRWNCWGCRRDILISPPSNATRAADHRDVPIECPYCGSDPKTGAASSSGGTAE